MNSDDFLCTRIAQISEAVIRQDWGRAYELIEEWESDDRLQSSPNREFLDSIPHDGWEVDDGSGLQFEDLSQCLS